MNIVPITQDDARIQMIEDGLDGYNAAFGPDGSDYATFGFAAMDGDGKFLGGCKGVTFAGWLDLKWLWAAERFKGVGAALLQRCEEHAREKNCKGIVLNTFEFQAPEFYKKHGFVQCGEIPNYIGDHKRFYFVKRFD